MTLEMGRETESLGRRGPGARSGRAACVSARVVPLALFARSRYARAVPAGETLTHSGTPDPSGARALHGDDDFSPGVSFSLVAERFRHLTQLVPAVDDRRDLSGFDEALEDSQVVLVVPDDEQPHSLAHEGR